MQKISRECVMRCMHRKGIHQRKRKRKSPKRKHHPTPQPNSIHQKQRKASPTMTIAMSIPRCLPKARYFLPQGYRGIADLDFVHSSCDPPLSWDCSPRSSGLLPHFRVPCVFFSVSTFFAWCPRASPSGSYADQYFLYFCHQVSIIPRRTSRAKALTASMRRLFCGSRLFVAPNNVCPIALVAPIAGRKMMVGARLSTAAAAP